MPMVTGRNDPILKALLELLGCPKHVRRIEYRSGIGEVTTVTVEYFPDVDTGAGAAEKLSPIVKRFELVEIKDGG